MRKTISERCGSVGIRMTGQRRLIIKVLENSKDHPDVETLFERSNKIDNKDQSYLVDHSTFSYLVDKNGRVLSFFNRRETPEKISEKIKCFY